LRCYGALAIATAVVRRHLAGVSVDKSQHGQDPKRHFATAHYRTAKGLFDRLDAPHARVHQLLAIPNNTQSLWKMSASRQKSR
jgi:hypothetical protein